MMMMMMMMMMMIQKYLFSAIYIFWSIALYKHHCMPANRPDLIIIVQMFEF